MLVDGDAAARWLPWGDVMAVESWAHETLAIGRRTDDINCTKRSSSNDRKGNVVSAAQGTSSSVHAHVR